MSKSGKSTGMADSSTNTLRREGTHTPDTKRRVPHRPDKAYKPYKPTLAEMTQQVNNLTAAIAALNRERADLLVDIWELHRVRMTADKARRR